MPRLKYASVLRVFVILALFCLWLQIMLSASSGGMYREGEELMNANETSEQVLALVPPELHKYLTVHAKNTSGNFESEGLQNKNPNEITTPADLENRIIDAMVNHPPHPAITSLQSTTLSTDMEAAIAIWMRQSLFEDHGYIGGANSTDRAGPKNITDIRRAILRYNEAQTIYNEDIFGPVQNDTIIIAIQVHTRLTYLRHLIVSLAQAKEIDRALLIFSHDYYDEEINSLVRTIDFTKVMQIFYPHSIQTHPHEYPGTDPKDCPRDAKFEQAAKLQCNNALHPDLHGHYREAKYTQTKHHWWWKANRIFNQLQCTTGHNGLVVFLEEDHYVAEDFLYMLQLLRSTADRTCPQCEILSLGTYLKTYQYHLTGNKRKKALTLNYIQQVKAANEERRRRMQDTQAWNFQVYPNLYSNTQKVEITPWHSSMHNMGFAFNRTVWNDILALQDQFCAYDDYNWDYSLLHLSQNRPGKEKFKVILCKGPRVFHIGECGFHHKKSNCNASTVISKVQKLLQTAKRYMFPSRVIATVTAGGAKHNKRLTKGNGGWGDIRDQQLCTNMTKIGRQIRKYVYFA